MNWKKALGGGIEISYKESHTNDQSLMYFHLQPFSIHKIPLARMKSSLLMFEGCKITEISAMVKYVMYKKH